MTVPKARRRRDRPRFAELSTAGWKMPDEAGAEAAKILGDGDGMQNLCYVLSLARYDDDFAHQLAEVGAVLNAAQRLVELEVDPELIPEPERIILNKACRLLSALGDDHIDRWMVRKLAGARASSDLETQLRGLLASLKITSDQVSSFFAENGVDLGIEEDEETLGIQAATDEIVRRLGALEKPDDVSMVGLSLRLGREHFPKDDL